jgi:hypothetical protein
VLMPVQGRNAYVLTPGGWLVLQPKEENLDFGYSPAGAAARAVLLPEFSTCPLAGICYFRYARFRSVSFRLGCCLRVCGVVKSTWCIGVLIVRHEASYAQQDKSEMNGRQPGTGRRQHFSPLRSTTLFPELTEARSCVLPNSVERCIHA